MYLCFSNLPYPCFQNSGSGSHTGIHHQEFYGLKYFRRGPEGIGPLFSPCHVQYFTILSGCSMNGKSHIPDATIERIALYARPLENLVDKGIKVIFVSDGNYSALLEDLVPIFDGFIVDYSMDIENILSKFGHNKLIIGNVSTDILTRKGVEEISKEVRRCMGAGKKYPGYIIKAAGDLPHNIPLRNMLRYFSFCRKYGIKNE